MKSYLIHDNGGRPFKVEINEAETQVTVYDNSNYDNSNSNNENNESNKSNNEEKKLLILESDKIFIGISRPNPMTEFSGGHGTTFDGNSILVKLHNDEYVFIGNEIYSFEPLCPIVSYSSPVGNSDVPYPYCIDEGNNYYLMIENIIIKPIVGYDMIGIEYNDPYSYYYGVGLMTPDMGRIPPRQPVYKNFANIKEWYIGNEKYTMRSNKNPSTNYDRLMELENSQNEMSVVLVGGEKKVLSKEEYVTIITDFQKFIGVKDFEKRVLVKQK